jgi:hypothetical protein
MLRRSAFCPSIALLAKGGYRKPRAENGPCNAFKFQPKPTVGFGMTTNQPGISQEHLDLALKNLAEKLTNELTEKLTNERIASENQVKNERIASENQLKNDVLFLKTS